MKMRNEWLQEGIPSPFSTIRRVAHVVASLNFYHPSLPMVQWVEPKKILQIKGRSIEVDSIAKMYHATLNKANEIFDTLTTGISTDVPFNFNDLIDDVVSREPGYSFLADVNTLRPMRTRLIEWAVSIKDGDRFILNFNDGTPVWNTPRLERFMADALKLNQLIMFIM